MVWVRVSGRSFCTSRNKIFVSAQRPSRVGLGVGRHTSTAKFSIHLSVSTSGGTLSVFMNDSANTLHVACIIFMCRGGSRGDSLGSNEPPFY